MAGLTGGSFGEQKFWKFQSSPLKKPNKKKKYWMELLFYLSADSIKELIYDLFIQFSI